MYVFYFSPGEKKLPWGCHLDQSQIHEQKLSHSLSLSFFLTNSTSLFILEMDCMARASVSIHIPRRTVHMGDIPCRFTDEEEDLQNDYSHPAETVMSLDVPHSAITAKASEASLSEDLKNVLRLLTKFKSMFDLGQTALTERVIETGNAKPVNLPPHRTLSAKKQISEAQVLQMSNDGIIEPSTSPWATPVVIVNNFSGCRVSL